MKPSHTHTQTCRHMHRDTHTHKQTRTQTCRHTHRHADTCTHTQTHNPVDMKQEVCVCVRVVHTAEPTSTPTEQRTRLQPHTQLHGR